MRSKLLLALSLLLGVPAALAAAVDPFYLSLLRDGELAFDRKDYPAAIRHLRLACFGMLDEPRSLADCLARLAIAQDRAEDVEGFRETFKRLAEVEQRFSAYTQGGVAPELRALLEPRLVTRLPAATLENEPAFRALVKKPDGKKPDAASNTAQKTGAPPVQVKKPEPAPPAAVKKPEGPVASTPAPAPPNSAAPVPASAAKPPVSAGPGGETKTDKPEPKADGKVEARTDTKAAAKPISAAERKKMDQARQLLSQERPAKDLKQAFDLAKDVADAHPDSKEAQHLAAEAAYRISRWNDAAAYFHRGGDPGDDQPERLFYLAVCLHESGDEAADAAALKRALPNLKRTPYVDSYAKSILGQ